MKILFLGYAVGEREAQALSGISIAGNKMNLNILHAMNKEVDVLESITIYPIAVFPQDKRVYVKKKKLDIGCDMYATRVPFLNIPFVKQISQMIAVYKYASKYVKRHRDTLVLTFNMYPPIGVPAVWLKKKYGCRLVSILADLPIDDNYTRKGISKLLRNVFDGQTKKNILDADQLVVLNQHAREVFAPEVDFLVMEGGINPNDYLEQNMNIEKSLRRNIVYGGSLAEYSGVKELIDAMEKVDDNRIELDIYGKGTLKEYVQSKQNARIHYHGTVSNVEMLEIQRKAWLLVNPRPVDDPIAKVTFPSKIFEYLMSGTPVLSTRLNGFTEEYEGKLFFAEDNSAIELSKLINQISKMSENELENIATKAKQFITLEKTWDKQVRRIVQFMSKDWKSNY